MAEAGRGSTITQRELIELWFAELLAARAARDYHEQYVARRQLERGLLVQLDAGARIEKGPLGLSVETEYGVIRLHARRHDAPAAV